MKIQTYQKQWLKHVGRMLPESSPIQARFYRL